MKRIRYSKLRCPWVSHLTTTAPWASPKVAFVLYVVSFHCKKKKKITSPERIPAFPHTRFLSFLHYTTLHHPVRSIPVAKNNQAPHRVGSLDKKSSHHPGSHPALDDFKKHTGAVECKLPVEVPRHCSSTMFPDLLSFLKLRSLVVTLKVCPLSKTESFTPKQGQWKFEL